MVVPAARAPDAAYRALWRSYIKAMRSGAAAPRLNPIILGSKLAAAPFTLSVCCLLPAHPRASCRLPSSLLLPHPLPPQPQTTPHRASNRVQG